MLWAGTFSSGSLTVNDAQDYTIFMIVLAGGVACLGTRAYGAGGFVGYGSYTVAQCGYRFTTTVSSNNIKYTIDSNNKGGCIDGAAAAVTEIYGII